MRIARLMAAAAAVLLAALPVTSHAATLSGVDAMSSTVMQEKQSSFSGLALRARIQPPSLIKEIEIMPSIEWWRNSNTIAPYGIETTRKDATLAIDARYSFHATGFRPYVGMGYAIHFLSSRVNAPLLGLNDASDSVTKGGLAALAGMSFGLNDRIDNFIELKYHHVPDYRQLKLNWGLSFKL